MTGMLCNRCAPWKALDLINGEWKSEQEDLGNHPSLLFGRDWPLTHYKQMINRIFDLRSSVDVGRHTRCFVISAEMVRRSPGFFLKRPGVRKTRTRRPGGVERSWANPQPMTMFGLGRTPFVPAGCQPRSFLDAPNVSLTPIQGLPRSISSCRREPRLFCPHSVLLILGQIAFFARNGLDPMIKYLRPVTFLVASRRGKYRRGDRHVLRPCPPVAQPNRPVIGVRGAEFILPTDRSGSS